MGFELLAEHTDLEVVGDKGYISADKAAQLLRDNRIRLHTLPRANQKRISGPMMDRIDIHLEVASVEVEKLASLAPGEPSSVIRQRVEAARAIQQKRFDRLNKSGIRCNDDIRPAEVQTYCKFDKGGLAIMRLAVERIGLSARAYHRVLKLSRAIAAK